MEDRANGADLESKLEAVFSATCKELGIMTLKLNVRGQRGWPDRVAISPSGRVLWVELKTRTGKLRSSQTLIISQLQDRHQSVFVWRTRDEVRQGLLHLVTT